MKKMKDVKWDKVGLFAGGVLFGTAGLKVLGIYPYHGSGSSREGNRYENCDECQGKRR